MTTTTKLVGIMILILIDDSNKYQSYVVPRCVFYPKTPDNILGVPSLGTFFGDSVDATDHIAEDGTIIKSGSTKLHFIWDHGSHEQNFMHGSIQIPELYLYVSHGYLIAFCTRLHKFFVEKVHFDFYSAYYIDPQTSDATHKYGPHVIPYSQGDLDGMEPHHQWYLPEIENPTNQSRDSNPKPKNQVTWSDDTKPSSYSGITPPQKSRDFQISMDLTYRDGMVKSVAVVYDGPISYGLIHTILLED